MRLALVISFMNGGGAERVMATLANGWVERGTVVRLITLGPRRDGEYLVDPRVERVALDVAGPSGTIFQAVRNNWRRVRVLRRAIRAFAPDMVLSFLDTTNVLSVFASVGLRVPVVVSDRIFVDGIPPRGAWRLTYRVAYRWAASVVAQTGRAATATERRVGRPVAVIPNPFRESHRRTDGAPPPWYRTSCKTLLAMGRLDTQKGFDLLLDAFSRVAAVHPGWRIVIVGEGSQRAALEVSVRELGLSGRVTLPGFTTSPENTVEHADLFVLSSRVEGFPNVLLEAMAEGKACISFDCPTGPAELIEHSVNGWLVPLGDVGALASGLDTLMSDAALRERLGARAREVRNRYSLESVLAQWDALFERVVASAGNDVRAMAADGQVQQPSPSLAKSNTRW